jgi:putative transposase
LDLRQRLIVAVEAGSSARAAARRLQVSASTAVKWVQRKRQTGSAEAKPMHGHPPAKLLPHKHRLLRLVAKEPDLTLRQIGERLAADGIHVSKSCLHSFLWRNRIRLKKDRPRRGAKPSRRLETS